MKQGKINVDQRDERGSRMAEVFIIVAIIALVTACAAGADESGISIKPHGAHGVEAGVDLASPEVQGWFAATVNPVPGPKEKWYATAALALPRLAEGTAKGAWNNKARTAGIVVAGVAGKRAYDGKLDDDLKKLKFWESEDKEKDPKGFKAKSELIQVPEDPRSFKGALATRQACQFLGQSTDKVKLKATFGESGSSTCEVDTNEPESAK